MYLLIYLTVSCLHLEYVLANNFAVHSGNILDYIIQFPRSLGLFGQYQNFGAIRNITNFKTLFDIDSEFSDLIIRSVPEHERNFVILDLLKEINKQLVFTYNNYINEVPEQQNKNTDGNFEELARQLVDEGRKVKTKKILMKVLVGLKVLTVGVILPIVLGVALFASWKGVTISLMALLLAGIVALKNVVAGKHETPQHVIVSPLSSHHQHWWRKTEGPEVISWDSPHELAYSGHR